MADQLRGDALFSYAVEHYLDTVYRAAFHAAPSPQDAEDVTQEVFEALLRSGKRFREPEHLRAWLLRVTVNKCKNLYRAKRRTEVPLTEAIPAPEAAEPSVLDEVRALPAPYRSTLYLQYRRGDREDTGRQAEHGALLAGPGAAGPAGADDRRL